MARTNLHASFGQKVPEEPIAAYGAASFVSNNLMLKLLLVAESESYRECGLAWVIIDVQRL